MYFKSDFLNNFTSLKQRETMETVLSSAIGNLNREHNFWLERLTAQIEELESSTSKDFQMFWEMGIVDTFMMYDYYVFNNIKTPMQDESFTNFYQSLHEFNCNYRGKIEDFESQYWEGFNYLCKFDNLQTNLCDIFVKKIIDLNNIYIFKSIYQRVQDKYHSSSAFYKICEIAEKL